MSEDPWTQGRRDEWSQGSSSQYHYEEWTDLYQRPEWDQHSGDSSWENHWYHEDGQRDAEARGSGHQGAQGDAEMADEESKKSEARADKSSKQESVRLVGRKDRRGDNQETDGKEDEEMPPCEEKAQGSDADEASLEARRDRWVADQRHKHDGDKGGSDSSDSRRLQDGVVRGSGSSDGTSQRSASHSMSSSACASTVSRPSQQAKAASKARPQRKGRNRTVVTEAGPVSRSAYRSVTFHMAKDQAESSDVLEPQLLSDQDMAESKLLMGMSRLQITPQDCRVNLRFAWMALRDRQLSFEGLQSQIMEQIQLGMAIDQDAYETAADGSVERGVRLSMKLSVEQGLFLPAGSDGKVSAARIDEARQELVKSMMDTVQDLGRAGSSRQQEVMTALTKGQVLWSRQSAESANHITYHRGKSESTAAERADLDAYVRANAVECVKERDPEGKGRERCMECNQWHDPDALHRCDGYFPAVYCDPCWRQNRDLLVSAEASGD